MICVSKNYFKQIKEKMSKEAKDFYSGKTNTEFKKIVNYFASKMDDYMKNNMNAEKLYENNSGNLFKKGVPSILKVSMMASLIHQIATNITALRGNASLKDIKSMHNIKENAIISKDALRKLAGLVPLNNFIHTTSSQAMNSIGVDALQGKA
ncbi:MAG TPA: hypothetical protein EYG89_02950, partial [Bacteroidia bacterium]|nr:hypothetical protein [Bacteroidia bacterium]